MSMLAVQDESPTPSLKLPKKKESAAHRKALKYVRMGAHSCIFDLLAAIPDVGIVPFDENRVHLNSRVFQLIGGFLLEHPPARPLANREVVTLGGKCRVTTVPPPSRNHLPRVHVSEAPEDDAGGGGKTTEFLYCSRSISREFTEEKCRSRFDAFYLINSDGVRDTTCIYRLVCVFSLKEKAARLGAIVETLKSAPNQIKCPIREKNVYSEKFKFEKVSTVMEGADNRTPELKAIDLSVDSGNCVEKVWLIRWPGINANPNDYLVFECY